MTLKKGWRSRNSLRGKLKEWRDNLKDRGKEAPE